MSNHFWLVGVTGGSGSGKSTACRYLASMGYAVIDADKVGHSIDAAADFQLAFGKDCIDPHTGRVNRPYLRNLIVKDKEVLKKTEAIMMPRIHAKIDLMIDDFKGHGLRIAFLDAPLLFETGFDKRCQGTICVTADRDRRLKRVMERDRQTQENTEGIFALQLPEEEKIKKADWIIRNNGFPSWLYKQTMDIVHRVHVCMIQKQVEQGEFK